MDFLLGKGEKTETKPLFQPQQEDVLNQFLGALQQQLPMAFQNLQNILGGGPEAFKAFERPARRGFEQETLPTIAERFTSQLGEGGFRSSAFGQAVGQAGKEMEEDLAARRFGMQGDALSQLMQFIGPAFTARQQQFTTPRQPGFLEGLGMAAAEGAGGAIGKGLPGAALGGGKGILRLLGLMKPIAGAAGSGATT